MNTLLGTIRLGNEIEDEVLTDLGLRPDKVYLRKIIKTTGDDSQLGIKGTVKTKDVAFASNPKIKDVSVSLIAKSNGYYEEGDIFVYISANVAQTELWGAQYWVWNDQLWRLIKVDAEPEANMPAQWKCLLRKHSEG